MDERPNVIMVMLDTVRSDCLGVYGGGIRANAINRIASKATIYDNAIAPGTYTVPSHVSFFLGQRVRDVKQLFKDPMANSDQNTDPFLEKTKYIKPGSMTLARKMSYLGYDTALFSNNPFVSQPTGIAEGFGHVHNLWYEDNIKENSGMVKLLLKMIENDKARKSAIKLASIVSRGMTSGILDKMYLDLRVTLNKHFAKQYGFYKLDRGALRTNESIKGYLSNNESQNKFMFINYMEAHEGYPTNLVSNDYVEQDKWLYLSQIEDPSGVEPIKRAYSKRVQYLDKQIGKLMEILKSQGALDNSVVVFAGDHGQAFMEHGQLYHNMFPYEQMTNVPLITARYLNGKQVNTKERIHNFVSLTALHNSILDIGYGKNEVIDGSLKRDNFVFSDHVGITEVWDTYLLKLFSKRSKSIDKIYRAKLHHNTFATAIYYKNHKLIHYFDKIAC